MQIPMFQPKAEWTPPSLSSLPSWEGASRVCIDTETRDPQLTTLGPGVRRDGYIVGISFAIEDGPSVYLPIRHAGGDNLDPEHVMNYMRDQAQAFKGDLVGANLTYDLDYLAQEGVVFKPRWFRDVQIAEPLLDELRDSYSLESIAEAHGLPGKDEVELRDAATAWGIDAKKDLWRLPGRFVLKYAVQDVRLPLTILRRQERMIEEQDLWDVFNLESKLLPILLKMRRRGIRVSLDRLGKIEDWSIQEETKALQEVKSLTGFRMNVGEVWNANIVAKALGKIGVELPKTKTGKPSTKKDILDTIDHPVAKALQRARKVNKVRTTFAESIRAHQVKGRIHCTLNQLRRQKEDGGEVGAAFGRLSSTDPNLQQQPSPDRDPEIGKMWRAIYLPEPGELWACKDYSQQEPRFTTHYAALTNCPGAAEAAKRYRDNPKCDNHTMMAQLIAGEGPDWVPPKKLRSEAKIIFLGLCYGMGGAKLCHSLKLPTVWKMNREGKMVEMAGPEGQALLSQFNSGVPYVRALAEKASKKVEKTGQIRTIGGRICRFPLKPEGGYDWLHKALNRLIQGSSADQTKTAMVKIDEAGYDILLQVHDEIDSSVPNPETAEKMADIMRTCVQLLVPTKVDIECGPSWGEIK